MKVRVPHGRPRWLKNNPARAPLRVISLSIDLVLEITGVALLQYGTRRA